METSVTQIISMVMLVVVVLIANGYDGSKDKTTVGNTVVLLIRMVVSVSYRYLVALD